MSITPSRRRTRVLLGAAAGLTLAVGAPLAASAHIHVTPDAAAADAATSLTFSFSHGCEDSPTTALVVDIPDGVTHVVPAADAGWTVQRDLADNGTVTRVRYTAATPVDSGLKGAVSMDVRFPADAAGTAVAFPVTQECVVGETAWTQVAAEGEPEPEAPAPLVSVAAASAGPAEAHGHGDHAGETDTAAAAESTASAPVDATARWLAGGALALGAAAVATAVVSLRRRR